jgi:hypothetical protein
MSREVQGDRGLRPGVAGCLLAAFATRVGSMTPEC